MTNLTITPEQLAATTRHIDESGKPYYTCQSATQDGEYTLRYVPQYRVLQCNCAAGREGLFCCWHKRAVMQAERTYQDMRKAERLAAFRIEATDEYGREQREQALVMAEINLK